MKQYLLVPALIAAIGVIYWFLSYEVAGTALLIIFALAMGLFGWVLVPTANNIGPVAPVDPDWHERER
ncbi:MAG TPA: hypothetical protein VHK06_08030 [Candidatus Limnocylindria bacterium]|nr:hypothetical protein [Candidatus Limnocylindria bacterium]